MVAALAGLVTTLEPTGGATLLPGCLGSVVVGLVAERVVALGRAGPGGLDNAEDGGSCDEDGGKHCG